MLFGRGADDPVSVNLQAAARQTTRATGQRDLQNAAGKIAQAMQTIGLDRWPRFVADAAARAAAPATQTAIDRSLRLSTPGRDAIRPVDLVGPAIGIAAAAATGGVAAAARAAGGALLRQVLPKIDVATSDVQKAAPVEEAPLPKANATPHAANRADFQKYTDGLRRGMERPATKDADLSQIIKDLYRKDAKVGSGSTADAVREERRTGLPVKGRWHAKKAADNVIRLKKWLRTNPTASPGDRAAAEDVLRDLQNALEEK